ncbi:MAG: hypothetical protein R3F21_04600 [Myxococcota bacterium]
MIAAAPTATPAVIVDHARAVAGLAVVDRSVAPALEAIRADVVRAPPSARSGLAVVDRTIPAALEPVRTDVVRAPLDPCRAIVALALCLKCAGQRRDQGRHERRSHQSSLEMLDHHEKSPFASRLGILPKTSVTVWETLTNFNQPGKKRAPACGQTRKHKGKSLN